MFFRGSYILAAMLAVSLFLPDAALAESRIEKVKVMDEIVVSADRTEDLARNVTRAVTVIDEAEIQKSRYGTLSQLLSNYGINITRRGNQPFDQIHIRGMSNLDQGNSVGGNVLLLIDGRVAGSSFISSVPMIAVERIEIIRGPSSVQYGSSAIGGAVNVITKRGGTDTRASIEIGGGSQSAAKTEMGISGSYGIFDFAGGLKWRTQGDDYTTGRGRYENTDLNHRTDYLLNIGVAPFEEHRLGIALMGSDIDNEGSPYYYDGVEQWGTTVSKTKYDYANRNTRAVDVTYDGGYKDWGLSWKARYFNTKDNYSFYSRNLEYNSYWAPVRYGDGYYHTRAQEQNEGTQAQLTLKQGILTLTGGFDRLDNTYRPNGDQSRTGLTDNAGFMLGKVNLFDGILILSAGVRYDDYTVKYENMSADNDKATYSVGLAVTPIDWMTVRFNYGTSFKMPSGMSVAGYKDAYNRVNPNFNLKPEEGKGWDVGIELNRNGAKLGVTYFRTDYEDQIYLNEEVNQYQNRKGTSKYSGIELQAAADLGDMFGWDFSLKPYVNLTKMITYEDSFGAKPEYVRNFDAAYGIGLDMPSIGFAADLRLTYFGHQYETRFNDDYSTARVKTGGFITADLFVTQRLYEWHNGGTLSLNASVTNIADRFYALKDRYPMPGRAFYAGLKYEY